MVSVMTGAAPTARVGVVQVTVPAHVIADPAGAGGADERRAGRRTSTTETLAAVPGPAFETAML